MRKVFYLIIVGLSLPLFIQAQMLNMSSNLPRKGDRLIKHQVTPCEPGKKGHQQIWDFSKVNLQEANYELTYTEQGTDTIIGTEHRTMYYYHASGDSLFCIGYENPTTFITYQKPELLFAFPVFQGSSVTDYFDASGNYCDQLNIRLRGKSRVTADASGMLILPEGDTLRKVLRICTHRQIHQKMTRKEEIPDSLGHTPFILDRDSIEYLLAGDSIHLETETWRWYADGYRYPVFETVKSTAYKFGKAYEHFTTSFVYLPDEQYYDLPYDTDNQERRDLIADEQHDREWKDTDKNTGDIRSDQVIDYSYGIGSDDNLYITYELKQPGEVFLTLFDLQGRQLTTIQRSNQSTGNYRETISMNGYPKGEYILRITVGKKVYAEKIIRG
ncbi:MULTISPECIES: T9SS type A sorting domain-containing protein [Bacteroides]|jgi:hypothetical protein|uniref:T9SS type A sorting domain-containing protein n=1 Tax=Bacteroides TaxID=816 RepID=UPI000E515595|nr:MULTISPECIES: T9SS type A sorting domain-containing protein [Bacteroides]RHL05065.1 T9SS C-terminal target domain-containing protein [Bacteroides sp. AF39-11AC]